MKAKHTRAVPRICASLVLLGTALVASAQQPLVPVTEQIWRPADARTAEAIALLPSPDGGVVLLSESLFAGIGDRWQLSRFDAQLQPMWSLDLNDFRFRIGALKTLADGNVLVLGSTNTSLIVELRALVDGELLWRYERALNSAFRLGQWAPSAVQRAGDQQLRIATASDDDVLLLRLSASGELLDSTALAVPGSTEQPGELALAADGRFAVTAMVRINGVRRQYRTDLFDATGAALATDIEPGTIGSVFNRPQLLADPFGGFVAHGSPESACGVHFQRVWRITPSGARDWTIDTPSSICRPREPTGWQQDHSGGYFLLSINLPSTGTGVGLARINAHGQLLWDHTWTAPTGGSNLISRNIAADDQDRVFLIAAQAVGNNTAAWGSVWSANGKRCMEGPLTSPTGSPQMLVTSKDGWVVASEVRPTGGGSSLYLQRYRADESCSPPQLIFKDGFEAAEPSK